jgi:hypothetical protein
VILIAGNVTGGAAFDFTHGMREAIPVGFALSIDVPCSFNLVGGRGHSPEEFARKVGTVDLRECISA